MTKSNKFKIWDTVKKEHPLYPFLIFSSGELFTIGADVGSSKLRSCDNGKDRGRYIVRPFTDLLAKNDVEIYDGDIVRAWGEDKVVRWGRGAWEPFDGNMNADKSYHYVVIGNIYENPEMVKP